MKKIAILLLVVTASCVTNTQITGSWKNPNLQQKRFNKIMVTAMTQNLAARQTVERNMAEAFSQQGIIALQGLQSMPPEFTDDRTSINKEELLEKIRKTGVDAIFTITLINRETENRYVPGPYAYAPISRYGYYSRFSGYYSTWYPTMFSPGYYEADEIYFIETNLYDVETEELIWSGQSRTYNPSDLKAFSRNFADVVMNRMTRDGAL